MEDKGEMWDTIFDKLISGEFDHATEIFKKAGITTDINEIVEKFEKLFLKKVSELSNELLKYNDDQLMGYIFMMIFLNWNSSTLNGYRMDALEKGPSGSKEFIKALSESFNEKYEKDFNKILTLLKKLDKFNEKKD